MKKQSHSPTSPEGISLRDEFRSAVMAAARRGGWKRLDRAALVAQFEGRVSRATAYRWLAALEGASIKRTVPELLKDARSEDLATVIGVAAEIKEAAKQVMPAATAPPLARPLPALDQTVATIVPVPVMSLLDQCIQAGKDVIAKSRGADGDVRNARLLLRAAENLRRSVETAAKLQEMMVAEMQVERFHDIIFEEISRIDPAVARRIATRLQELNASWTGRLEAERSAGGGDPASVLASVKPYRRAGAKMSVTTSGIIG